MCVSGLVNKKSPAERVRVRVTHKQPGNLFAVLLGKCFFMQTWIMQMLLLLIDSGNIKALWSISMAGGTANGGILSWNLMGLFPFWHHWFVDDVPCSVISAQPRFYCRKSPANCDFDVAIICTCIGEGKKIVHMKSLEQYMETWSKTL